MIEHFKLKIFFNHERFYLLNAQEGFESVKIEKIVIYAIVALHLCTIYCILTA